MAEAACVDFGFLGAGQSPRPHWQKRFEAHQLAEIDAAADGWDYMANAPLSVKRAHQIAVTYSTADFEPRVIEAPL